MQWIFGQEYCLDQAHQATCQNHRDSEGRGEMRKMLRPRPGCRIALKERPEALGPSIHLSFASDFPYLLDYPTPDSKDRVSSRECHLGRVPVELRSLRLKGLRVHVTLHAVRPDP